MRPAFARRYERFTARMEAAWLDTARAALLGHLHGTVVEIGAGTGRNLDHYPPAVERLILSEPTPAMRDQLRTRVRSSPSPFPIEVIDATADRIPVPDASADAVVSTLVLCSVPDVRAAVHEIGRILRPGGRVHLVEHVVAPADRERRWQRRLTPAWRWLEGSCQLDHDPVAELVAAGFDPSDLHTARQPGMPPLFRTIAHGVAVLPDPGGAH